MFPTNQVYLRVASLDVVGEARAGGFAFRWACLGKPHLSGRGSDRMPKLSQAIADWEGAQSIEMHHVAAAIFTGPPTQCSGEKLIPIEKRHRHIRVLFALALAPQLQVYLK